MLSYWYIFAHCSTMNLKSGKPLFLGQKTGGYRLQHNQMWFFTFFLVSIILYIKFWAVCCCVLPSEWVKSISTTLNHSHFLFTTMWSVLTYSLVLYFFFLGEIGFTWRLLQKISSYWYRKSWIGKPLPLCIVVPSLPKALLLLLGRFLLLMLLLPFLVKKNMIM